MAAAALFLNGWTGDRPVRTKYAAVARLGLEQRFTLGALVKILTRIRRHDLRPCVAAAWAGEHGFEDDSAHGLGAANTLAHSCLVAVRTGPSLHHVAVAHEFRIQRAVSVCLSFGK